MSALPELLPPFSSFPDDAEGERVFEEDEAFGRLGPQELEPCTAEGFVIEDPVYEAASPAPTTPRRCLSCDEMFDSYDPKKNRICPRCSRRHKTGLSFLGGGTPRHGELHLGETELAAALEPKEDGPEEGRKER